VLSVHRLGAGSEGYYLDQVVAGVEDDHVGAGEAPGEWLASSALLGLEGRVDPDDLRLVLLGADPRSGDGLHNGSGRSVPGWDLTFRAPKSVSILWGLTDPQIAAVERMTANDGVVVGHNADLVRQRMADDWFEHRSGGASAVMMASRNSDVDDLNRRAHQLMSNHGHLHGEPLHLDGRPFQIGGRVVCLRNDRRLGVRNGTVGDITHINHQHRTLTIDTPDGTRQLSACSVRAVSPSFTASPSRIEER